MFEKRIESAGISDNFDRTEEETLMDPKTKVNSFFNSKDLKLKDVDDVRPKIFDLVDFIRVHFGYLSLLTYSAWVKY